MSYAPSEFYPLENGGCFRESETGNFFEYCRNSCNLEHTVYPDFYQYVFVGSEMMRYAKVFKKVAYIVVDEDERGEPVIEKWQIKNHCRYNT